MKLEHLIKGSNVRKYDQYADTSTILIPVFQWPRSIGFEPKQFVKIHGRIDFSSFDWADANTLRLNNCSTSSDSVMALEYVNADTSVQILNVQEPTDSGGNVIPNIECTIKKTDKDGRSSVLYNGKLPYMGTWKSYDKISIEPKNLPAGYFFTKIDWKYGDSSKADYQYYKEVSNHNCKSIVLKEVYDKAREDGAIDYPVYSGAGNNDVKTIKITDIEVGRQIIASLVFKVPFCSEIVTGRSEINGLDMMVNFYELLSMPQYISFHVFLRVMGVTANTATKVADTEVKRFGSGGFTKYKIKIDYDPGHIDIPSPEYEIDPAMSTSIAIPVTVRTGYKINSIKIARPFQGEVIVYTYHPLNDIYAQNVPQSIPINMGDCGMLYTTLIIKSSTR